MSKLITGAARYQSGLVVHIRNGMVSSSLEVVYVDFAGLAGVLASFLGLALTIYGVFFNGRATRVLVAQTQTAVEAGHRDTQALIETTHRDTHVLLEAIQANIQAVSQSVQAIHQSVEAVHQNGQRRHDDLVAYIQDMDRRHTEILAALAKRS